MSLVQDELAKLNQEIEQRHEQELQLLEQREQAAASSSTSTANGASAAAATAAVAPAADPASKYLKELSIDEAEAEEQAGSKVVMLLLMYKGCVCKSVQAHAKASAMAAYYNV